MTHNPLRRARLAAGAVLAFATIVFFATFLMGEATWVGFLRSAAEAGMIGGLADWFAVTALFRHPLGIPIPHTAIIPSSKEALGQNLAEFMTGNFLDPDTVRERLAEADLPSRIGQWLADDHGSNVAATHIATILGAVAEGTTSDQVWADLEGVLTERMRRLPVAEMVGKALERSVQNGEFTPAITAVISGFDRALSDNEEYLRRRIHEESPWWVPDTVDDAVFAKAIEIAHRFLREVGADPDHPVRAILDERLVELAGRLETDPDLARRISDKAGEFIDRAEFKRWLRSAWTHAMANVADQSEGIAHTLRTLGRKLLADQDLQDRMNGWLDAMSGPLAAGARKELETLIPATVARWDPEETAGRLEQWMGRDLQFVRINGTVVGALIGLVLHTIVVTVG